MKNQEFYTLEDFVNSGIIQKVTNDTMANIKSTLTEVPKGYMPEQVTLSTLKKNNIAEREYMIGHNGEQYGPYSHSQILTLLMKGEITKETLIWREGLNNWISIGECMDFIGA